MPIRLLVADRCRICLAGIASLFRNEPDFQIVATTQDGESAVQTALTLRPDIVVLDVNLRSVSGIATLARVRFSDPSIRGVIFSSAPGDQWAELAEDAGAAAWLSKDLDFGIIVSSLRAVHAGRQLRRPGAELERSRANGILNPLSPREIEVLRLLVQGHTSRGIATALGCQPRTVDKHRESLRRKLGLHSNAALISYGLLLLREMDLRGGTGDEGDSP